MIEQASVSLDLALVYADRAGEDLDQVILHLSLVLVDRLLPGHRGRGLHVLLGQESHAPLEELDTLREAT